MRATASLVVVLLLAPASAQEPVQDPLDGVIQHAWYLRPETANHYTAPEMVLRIARDAGVPAGAEFVPGECDYRRAAGMDPDPGNWIPLLGLTYREALAQVKAFDDRYHIIESDGVVLIRPLDAWADEEHFLHLPIGAFAVKDEHAYAALNRWRQQWAGRAGRPLVNGADLAPRTAEGARLLTFDVPAASAILGLDAIVRAHGRMTWRVRYCRPETRPEFATVFLWTHDGSGRDARLSPLTRGPDGSPVNPCRP